MSALGNRIDLGLVSLAHRIGVPEKAALCLVKGRRIAADPAAWARHRRAGHELAGRSAFRDVLPPDRAYALFGPEFTPELPPMLAAANAAFAELGGIEAFVGGKKPFFTNVLDVDALSRHPAILDFVAAPAVVETVACYLGTLPRVQGLGLFVSPANDSTRSSQLYHIDGDDFRQVKVFVNLEAVDAGAGPFTFLPADVTARVRAGCGHAWGPGRLEDAAVFRHCRPEEQVVLAGPAGAGCFIDTARCLHFGSRARAHHRVVLMVNYTQVPDIKLDKGKFGLDGMPIMRFPEAFWGGDERRRALLAPYG